MSKAVHAAWVSPRPARPWQVEPIKHASFPDVSEIPIFMDKRLGKCKVAIHWAMNRHVVERTVTWPYGKSRPANMTLIVAPLSAVQGWIKDLTEEGLTHVLMRRDCGGNPDDPFLHMMLDNIRKDGKHRFYIINPESVFYPAGRKRKCWDCGGTGFPLGEPGPERCHKCIGGWIKDDKPFPTPLALYNWDCVIWDESTRLANPKTQTNQVAQVVFKDTPNKAILSGEYVPENVTQVFEQMRFLYGSFMGHRKYWPWINENFNEAGYDLIPKKGKMQEIREAVAARAIILSRKDAGVAESWEMDLQQVDLPQKIRKAYDLAERHMELPDDTETKHAVSAYTWLLRITGGCDPRHAELRHGAKLDLLEEICKRDYPKDPLVVLFRFNDELQSAYELLTKKKVKVAKITGATPLPKRIKRVERFQAGKLRVLLLQIKVARFGLNLSAADTMIRYSVTSSYEDISQSRDRIVDPMKKRPLMVIDIVARDTVDEDILEAVGDKKAVARRFMARVIENTKKRRRGKK